MGNHAKVQQDGRLPSAMLTGSSIGVSRIISLEVLGGFIPIVLLGVDLNSSNHLFEIVPSF